MGEDGRSRADRPVEHHGKTAGRAAQQQGGGRRDVTGADRAQQRRHVPAARAGPSQPLADRGCLAHPGGVVDAAAATDHLQHATALGRPDHGGTGAGARDVQLGQDQQVQPVVDEGVGQPGALGDGVRHHLRRHRRTHVERGRARPGGSGHVDLDHLHRYVVDGGGRIGGRSPARERAQPHGRVAQREGRHPAHGDAVVPGHHEHPHPGRRRGRRVAADPGPPDGQALQLPERAAGQEQVLHALAGLLLRGPTGGTDVAGQGLQVSE